ncbi:MBL fold metallo-hydrolase [Polaribacter tangerinus]|uniref:MBL fold metallo-hydrolase n=1 Tax=Polaribacter tangerinus TaxID=1920034 RepID=UPI000B4ADC7A|nr:MBL fold metallo-hydrolase [Polaribacter tangerinus]
MNSKKKLLTVTFLGTGTSQGVPMIASKHPVCMSKNSKDKRLRSSVLISWDDKTIVIDCGPDFRQQMLRENVQEILAVLFTHEHSDHTAGIDDLRPYCYQIGAMPIYLNKRTLQSLEKRFEYIFSVENRYPGAPSVLPKIVNEVPFEVYNMPVTPLHVLHGNLPILGYKIQNFAYLTDVKTIPLETEKQLYNLEVLVINALRQEEHPTHFNLDEALALVDRVQPKRTYFTHISHKLGFHDEVEKKLPANVYLAFDGLKIEI